jgi:glycosyltransferase involved in cell wall biosynthesis
MRILWYSNSPWTKTGYGAQTALFVPRLQKLGHAMAIHAWYGLMGGALHWGDIPVYPIASRDTYGRDVIAAHSDHFKADIVITLLDAWVFEPSLHVHGMKWCPWFPIDMQPIPPIVVKKVADAFQPIVYSRYGEREALRAGLDVLYVPHGVDTKVFAQMHEDKARELTKLPTDRWVVGMVAANKGVPSRKAFEPSLRAFRDFHAKHPDALLYLHTLMSDQDAGMNLTELLGVLGLEIGKDVIVTNQYDYTLGMPPEYMAALYNSFDVLLACSMGEGFGIPIVEAQACGTPVITGDWTSMSELTWRGAMVDRSSADPFYTGLAAYQFQPRVGAIVEALEQVYAKTWVRHVPDQVAEYDADHVVQKYWKPVLNKIADRLELERPAEKVTAAPVAIHPNGAKALEAVPA